MNTSRTRALLAATLAILLAIPAGPALASAGAATLGGRVVSAGSYAPLAGARVFAGDGRTGRIATSGITGPDGSFEIAGLEPAVYDVAVESRGGLYLVQSPVRVAGGERRSLQLAISPQTTPPTGETGQAPAQAPPKKKSATDVWNNPLTATLIVVGAAVVLGLIVGNSTSSSTTASPSTP